jgi:hypothetical protein
MYGVNYSDFNYFLQRYFVSLKRNQKTGKFDLVIKFNNDRIKFSDDYYGDVIRLAMNFINSRVL